MAAAQRASLGAAAGARRPRARGTEWSASRNPPAADTAALIGARGRHHPEGAHTDEHQHTGPNQVKSAAGAVQLCAIKDTGWSDLCCHTNQTLRELNCLLKELNKTEPDICQKIFLWQHQMRSYITGGSIL